MASAKRSDLTFNIKKLENFPAWYEEILQIADIVDKRTNIKGITVMPPYGCFIHTAIMQAVEEEWVKQGIARAQFPTLIPEPLLCKEESHFAGFVPEVFWVTKGGTSDLNPRLALRPTSETIMYSTFANWIQSYRDLPIKVQQSCQVFRCETKDTSPLIRAREIYWNEAHCCHATAEECELQCLDYWRGYRRIFDEVLAVPGLYIRRPPWDTFPGAVYTDVIDCILPSGRVLQSASAHFLGQSFSKMYEVKFLGPDAAAAAEEERLKQKQQPKKKPPKKEKKKKEKGGEKEEEKAKAEGESGEQAPSSSSAPETKAETETEPAASSSTAPAVPFDNRSYAYMNCAGISTRGLAAVLSVHGDDQGLVIPASIAPIQVVIVPILKGKEEVDKPLMEFVYSVEKKLKSAGFRTSVDNGPGKPGPKFFFWEMKGVPARLEIGPRDQTEGVAMCILRNQKKEDKVAIPIDDLPARLNEAFKTFHDQLFAAANAFHTSHVEKFESVDWAKGEFTLEDLKKAFVKDDISKPCVFRVPICSMTEGGKDADKKIREETGLEVRGYDVNDPLPPEGTKCIATCQPAERFVYVARAY